MFIIENIRKENKNGWTFLKCDFTVTEIESPFSETTMWVAVEEDNGDMLSDELYDSFVLVPTILGMYYNQDVHISGNISPRLYHNMTHYIMKIFNNFSDFTHEINLSVDGTKVMKNEKGKLIGTGISCGVDSLLTIYDNYEKEDNSDYKINSLFFVNCGTHGDYENESSKQLWMDRAKLNKQAADDLKIPMYLIDSNYHAFTHKIGEQKIGYLAIYSCVLSLQKVIKRYLTSSNLSYDEIADNRKLSRDFDIAEYCESYMPHLIATERFELVIDGCQYTRPEKIERISDWAIAHKHLNVCVTPKADAHGKNCSCCEKCMWTLIPLEAMGKLNEFSKVFDLDEYRYKSKVFKSKFVYNYGKDAMESSIVDYCKASNLGIPTFRQAKKAIETKKSFKDHSLEFYYCLRGFLGRTKRRLMGEPLD